tara:strand:- start:501 stop:1295 length:795 start_codon:yes stop_codon:yes gene_type:complete
MASKELVIRSGEELNDQTPEGPGPEEFMQMDDEDIVSSYISNIKMYPEYADIKDQEGFAEAFLPALENMNNVAQRFMTGTGSRDNPMYSKLEYGDGMTIATEIYTGAITDYIATGFRNKEEFYEWYLRDVANLQVVMQPGQIQTEDFSVVDKDFYNDGGQTNEPFVDPMPVPNTRFPRKPEKSDEVKPEEINPKFSDTSNLQFDKFRRPGSYSLNPNVQNLPPETNPMQNGQDYFNMLADVRRIKPKSGNTIKEKNKPEKRRFF